MKSWVFYRIWVDTVDYCFFVGTVDWCFCGCVDACLVHSNLGMYFQNYG